MKLEVQTLDKGRPRAREGLAPREAEPANG
jgi:hypothetical protein